MLNITNTFKNTLVHPETKHGFNLMDIAYWLNPERFSNLISNTPDFKSIPEQIEKRSNFIFRNELHDIILNQYKSTTTVEAVNSNINALKSKDTFTVICAHQPCLMGGPLYWIYKISSTIALCRQLKYAYPEYNFIPIYYCGSEDHDFEEINHFHLFNQKFTWENPTGSAVGKMQIDQIIPVIEQLSKLFLLSNSAKLFLEKNEQWLKSSENYISYYRHFVNDLFGIYGLIFFDPDDTTAKKLFSPIIEAEIKTQFIHSNSNQQITEINKIGFQAQVKPRVLNLFYHHPEGRKRIVLESNLYRLIDLDKQWFVDEIINELHEYPERFSPNVLLRPIYQEYLFPNLAFIGGGGEIAYWLELKTCFDSVNLPYPLIFRRMSAFYYETNIIDKISKTPFDCEDFLESAPYLEESFVKLQDNKHLIQTKDLNEISNLLEKIKNDLNTLDQSTRISIESEIIKINKSLEHIESKHVKAIKNKLEIEIINIRKVKEALFPHHSIQERFQNFLPHYFKHGSLYLDHLISAYNAESHQLILIQELKIKENLQL